MSALAPCGTQAAYQRHLYHGEDIDLPCRLASARDRAQRRRKAARDAYAWSVGTYRRQWRQARQARFERDLAEVIGVLAALMDNSRKAAR